MPQRGEVPGCSALDMHRRRTRQASKCAAESNTLEKRRPRDASSQIALTTWLAASLATFALIAVAVPAGAARQTSTSTDPQKEATTPAQQSMLEHRTSRYQLQSQDVLVISFPLTPELDETVSVQPDGYINLLGTEDLLVRGLTVPGLVEALQGAYSKVLNHPIINISLKDFQTPFFVVSGQVARPGQFTLRYDTTVTEGIALAGGLTPAAKSHIFLLRRASAGRFKVTPVSLQDILSGRPVEDTLLQSGDMLYVPEKFITKFRTYVPYSIGLYASPQLAF